MNPFSTSRTVCLSFNFEFRMISTTKLLETRTMACKNTIHVKCTVETGKRCFDAHMIRTNPTEQEQHNIAQTITLEMIMAHRQSDMAELPRQFGSFRAQVLYRPQSVRTPRT
jgi:hypothetical protein